MVRGNWQKRVETADARRKEAKQRKHRSEEKRIFKSMAQELLSLLDRNMDAIRRRSPSGSAALDSTTPSSSSTWDIQIWTDTLPSDLPPFLDIVEADGKSSRKARSASMDDTSAATFNNKEKNTGRKGRGRSGSFQEGGGKNGNKKVHPRSKEADAALVDEFKTFAPLLCRSQFFFGKCMDPQKGGKKGGCRCVHFNNKQVKTLAAVLAGGKQKVGAKTNQQDTLAQAEEACFAHSDPDIADASPGSMEMVYFLTIPIPNNIGESQTEGRTPEEQRNADQSPSSISDLITEKLTANSCGIASIAYMVISHPSKDILLYDRNQDGVVIVDFASDVLGSEAASDGATGDKLAADMMQAEHLPVSILEHILAYVEAPGVASAAQVCTAWHREIGQASPNLWRHLLEQRHWPLPAHIPTNNNPDHSSTSIQDSMASENMSKSFQNEFIKHYSILRDMRAIQSALAGLLTKKPCEEREMTFQAFSARRGAPQAPNHCVAIEVWGPNQVLAAYSNDCTLRLFQAVPRSGSNNESGPGNQNDKFCRELVCQTIDPYNRTKKKCCLLEAMGLDEDVVGCLLSVSDDTNDCNSPHILVILKRDDLLVVDFSSDTAGRMAEPEEGSLHVIDVEEAVLNYILSLDHVDHRLLRLHDFLALGGDDDEVEFIVSQSLAACGYGRFMVEVAISIPFPDDDDDNNDDLAGDMLLLDRKLFLFSSSVGAIVWMGDSNPPNEPLRPRSEDTTLASVRRALPGSGTRSSCSVAAVSHAFAPFVMSCEIDHSGHIEGSYILGSSEWAEAERATEEGWSSRLDGHRPIVLAPTDVVVGDTLTRALDDQHNNERHYKSIITFYSRYPVLDDNEKSMFKLAIGDNCMIDRMVGVRDDYIVLLVRFFTETGFPAVDGGGGHWGGEMDRVARVFAITIHVPSRCEIERLCLYEDFGWNRLSLSVVGGTLGVGVWLKGLIMTGSDVRSVKATNNKTVVVLDDVIGSRASKKKNKNRKTKRAGKKDGFARGMSLRG